MTITSLLEIRITPESTSTARTIIDGVLTATRAFDGCLGVDVVVDLEDATHIMLVERWESVEHDDAYRSWRATPEGKGDWAGIIVSRSLARYSDL